MNLTFSDGIRFATPPSLYDTAAAAGRGSALGTKGRTKATTGGITRTSKVRRVIGILMRCNGGGGQKHGKCTYGVVVTPSNHTIKSLCHATEKIDTMDMSEIPYNQAFCGG